MDFLLVLGLIVSALTVFDILAALFGADSRPDFGSGHTILV